MVVSRPDVGVHASLLPPTADGDMDYLAAPFLIRNAKQIYLAGTLPDGAAERLLPVGVLPAVGNTCIMAFLDCPDGWKITPFHGFYCGIVIEGHDAPDGTNGVFMVAGSYSGKAGTHLKNQVSDRLEVGTPNFHHLDADASADAHVAGLDVAVDVSVTSEAGYIAGTRLYVGLGPKKGLRVWTVAYSTPIYPVAINKLTVDATGHLAALQGFTLEWAALCLEKSMTFGEVRDADGEVQAARRITTQTGLLDVFDRLGKAAAVVDGSGLVRFRNAEAERVGVGTGRLRALTGDDQALLGDRLASAIARSTMELGDPVALSDTPVRLIQIVPIDPSLAGDDVALAVFIEPSQPRGRNTPQLLQLLGLTPAEAKLAALVGAGQSPGQSAALLKITTSTARSTLRVVYDKLMINRQSELAGIVARLE